MSNLAAAYTARDIAMAEVEQSAGAVFAEQAKAFVIDYLTQHPNGAHGEDITDACKNAGIIPHDDRAFGPVYMRLSRMGLIQKIAHAPRAKGHATSGGNIWQKVK